ncbi:MAG: TonB-dependent receptor [Bacteroidetes bacterium]|nr:TonB-dependent receptor [Bacteroidota bacterium]
MAKLTTLFILISFLQISANSYSQTGKLDLKLRNATILEVFEHIEDVSTYRFFYDNEQIDLTKEVSINTKDAELSDILKELLDDTDLTWEVKDKLILVQSKNTKANSEMVAQQKSITGTVTDEDGETLPGVTVLIKGTTNGTVTNMDGNYSIANVPENTTLQFSFVGMLSQEIIIGDQPTINVTMAVDAIGIEEVVAIGYGTQKKVNLTGAVASVKGEVLTKSPAASTANTLAGRLPGLVVKQTSGQPGFDQSRINIRNFGNALIIVDGTEQSFNNIDPNEIESISILKDASAAIYGARAGNGVILITTKRGTAGKPTITVNSTMTGQAYTNFPEPVNAGQYATLHRESQLNSGVPEAQLQYSEEDIAKYFDGTDPQYPNTNWEDEIMRDWAPQHQHNISMAGGSEKVKYYTFLGYLNQDGMFEGDNTGYERYNVRSNIDASITSQLSMSLDLSAIKENVQESNRPASQEWFWMDFLDSKPTAAASFPDETKVPHIGPGPFNAIINTHEDLGGYDKRYKTTLNGSLSLKYDVKAIKGLSLKLKGNYFQYTQDRKVFTKENEIWDYNYDADTYVLYGKSFPTSLNQSYATTQVITGQFGLNYSNTFNEHHSVDAMLLYEAIDYSSKNYSAYRENYITSAIDQLFAGGTINQQANGSAAESGRQSLIGRVNYGYKGKYLLEVTARYDGSPNFPENKRWGFFPSISAGWRISEESFLKDNISWIDNLKLRGGISQTGYDGVPPYQYLAGYQFSGYYVSNGAEVPGLSTTGLPNTNITWETMTLSNIGLDLSVFKGKIYTEIDVFQRLREDMLGSRTAALPSTFGASLPHENINSQTAKGFEFLLGTKGGAADFKYDINANVSYSRSEWDYFEEVEYTDPDDIRINQRTGQFVDIGFGYKNDGLFTSQSEIDNLTYDMDGQGNATLSPGDIKLLDINDDGKLDWRDYVKINDGGTPHIMYGLNINLAYKNFDFSLLAQGASNYSLQLQAGNINIDSQRTPSKVIWEERWTPENNDRNAIIPRQKFSQITNNWNSDYWSRDASYIRLKNVSLGYTFNSSLVKRIGLDQLRVFATGTNLFTYSQITKYGLDPESPDATRGWTYPIQKTVSLGINLKF